MPVTQRFGAARRQKMTLAGGEVTRDVPLMPGGRRMLGHALEFGRDPLALLQRARERTASLTR